jgi:putative PIG3 family NAD(P)H quinone oxidoreductase
MKAIVLASHGGPEVLTLREVPDPEPGPDEVVVQVVSSALNRADVLQRMGLYAGPRAEHEVPGLELAGRVVRRGERAERWQVGDAVMGIVGGGAHAEQVVVHERQLVTVPDALPLADAGAVPEAFMTAWDAMVVLGGLTPGGTVLVHAGASGVGTAAIQYAKAIGCRVVATASAGKLEACRSLGADVAVDYRSQDFAQVCRDLGGVDVVLDLVGGDYLAGNVQAVKVKGHIVLVGLVGGGSTTAPLGQLLSKRVSLTGTVLRARPLEEKIAVAQRFSREVLPFLAAGTCRPVVDRRYPLAEVADAHRRIESNETVGKLVLDVTPG